jgi:hypothetical protein
MRLFFTLACFYQLIVRYTWRTNEAKEIEIEEINVFNQLGDFILLDTKSKRHASNFGERIWYYDMI